MPTPMSTVFMYFSVVFLYPYYAKSADSIPGDGASKKLRQEEGRGGNASLQGLLF